MLTLWSSKTDTVIAFDRKANVGLHHLALQVPSEAGLNVVYDIIIKAGITVEFGPELVKDGPAKHMMCYDPCGIRIEFIWNGMTESE